MPDKQPSSSAITVYGNQYGHILKSFEPTSDGGFIFAGYTNGSNANAEQGFIQKCTKNGKVTWLKYYGDTLEDVFNAVHTTSDGGFIAAGSTSSFGKGVSRKDYFRMHIL